VRRVRAIRPSREQGALEAHTRRLEKIDCDLLSFAHMSRDGCARLVPKGRGGRYWSRSWEPIGCSRACFKPVYPGPPIPMHRHATPRSPAAARRGFFLGTASSLEPSAQLGVLMPGGVHRRLPPFPPDNPCI
jgi:hypothetical protein